MRKRQEILSTGRVEEEDLRVATEGGSVKNTGEILESEEYFLEREI